MGWESNYNTSTKGTAGEMYAVGIAYVVIPYDVDRSKYIAECFKTYTISIYSEHNGVSNRVPVDMFSINFIEFPNKPEEFGSPVSFVVDPISKKPIVNGIYIKTDNLNDNKEYQFKFKRTLNGNVVEIVGSPDAKSIALNVQADSAGEISLNVRSKDKSASLRVDIDGDVEITSANNTTIKQYNKLTIATIDPESGEDAGVFEQTVNKHEFFDTEHKLNTLKLNINDGDEPFILGKTFKELFDKFIEEVSEITVTTSLGQMPILNAQQVADFKDKTETILSQLGFIDK